MKRQGDAAAAGASAPKKAAVNAFSVMMGARASVGAPSSTIHRFGKFAPTARKTETAPAGWEWLAQLPAATAEQQPLHIMSFNANGLWPQNYAQSRLPGVIALAREHIALEDCPMPDVVIVQETKVADNGKNTRTDQLGSSLPGYSLVLALPSVPKLKGKNGVAVFVRDELAQWTAASIKGLPQDAEGRALILTLGTTAIVGVYCVNTTKLNKLSLEKFNGQLKQLLLSDLQCCTTGTVLIGDCNVNLTPADSGFTKMWGGAQPAFFRNVVLAAKPAGAQLIDVFRRDNPELLAYTYQVHCSFTLRITVHYSTLCTRLKTAFTLTEVCCCKA
jgi:exonuclease III